MRFFSFNTLLRISNQEATIINHQKSIIDELNSQLAAKEAEIDRLDMELQSLLKKDDSLLILAQKEAGLKAREAQRLERQCADLESKLNSTQTVREELLAKVESLYKELSEERQSSFALKIQVKNQAVYEKTISELNALITDMRDEKRLLEQEYNKLLQNQMSKNTTMVVEKDNPVHIAQIDLLKEQLHGLKAERDELAKKCNFLQEGIFCLIDK